MCNRTLKTKTVSSKICEARSELKVVLVNKTDLTLVLMEFPNNLIVSLP